MASRDIRRAASKKKKEEKGERKEHKQSKKPLLYLFSVVLLIIIIVTFVGGGLAGGVGQDPNRLLFGHYKDRPIEFRYGNYFSRQTQILSDQMRDESTDSDDITGQAFSIWRQAFERTVVHEGILDTVESSGLTVTDNLIDIRLTEYGPYMENGEFSEERYRATSKTEKAVTRRLFRGNLKEEQFLTDFFDNQHISEKEIEFVQEMASPERNFRYVYFPFSEFPEELVEEYAGNNARLFQKIKLSKITINSGKADAEAVYRQITENPAVFSELAQTQSVDSFREKGGEMDWMMYYQLEPEFPSEESLDAVFRLKTGEVSDIIEQERGDTTSWTIYKCDSPAVAADFDDDETIATVRSYMERYEGGLIEDYLLAEAEEFREAAKASSFTAASTELGVDFDITDYFPINYGNSFFLKPVRSMTDIDVLGSAMYNEQFFKTAFSIAEGQISEPVILEEHIIVLELINQREAPEEVSSQLETYYPFIVRQNRDEALRRFFLSSEHLQDNFYPVFQEMFLNNS